MPSTLRLALASFALAMLCFGTAQADTITYTGDTFLRPNGRFNRPQENGTLSPIGTSVPYGVLRFTVTAGGTYNFLSVSTETNPAFFNPFLVLYSGAFNPANPTANFVIANDDLGSVNGLGGSPTQSSFTTTLSTSTNYFLVTTGKTGQAGVTFFDAGAFRNTISGPGAIVITAAAVPEPTTMLLFGTGLAGVGVTVRRRRKASIQA